MPGNGEPQSGATAVAIARRVEAEKWLENALAFGRRNAWTAVIHQNDRLAPARRHRYCRPPSILHRIVNEIANDPRQRRRLALDV